MVKSGDLISVGFAKMRPFNESEKIVSYNYEQLFTKKIM